MRANAVILGGNALNIGVVDILHSLGFNVIVVDYRENITLKCDCHIVFDAKDPKVTEVLKNEGIDNVKIVYTSMDNAGLAQRNICKEYNLNYADEYAMLNAHYKNKMHETWEKAKLLNRESFALVNFDLMKIRELNSKYKIIIKPSDSCASRGISILEHNSSIDELEAAFAKAKQSTTNNYVNIEEFIDGTEFTVEMLGDNIGNVLVFGISKKYHSQNAGNNKVAVKLHYNPSDVNDDTKNKIAEYGIKCYKALGLKNTLGHLEIILKPDGTLSPVEIGARSSGFIASHLAQIGTGKIFLNEYMNVLNGKTVYNGYLKHGNESAMYYFYDFPDGTEAVKDSNIIKFLNSEIKSLYHDRTNLSKGSKYQKLNQDTDRYGFEILIGPKDILTIEEVEKAEKKFLNDLLGNNI